MDISVENFVWILGIQKGGGAVINFSYTKTM